MCLRRIVGAGAGVDTTPKNNLLTRAPGYVLDVFLKPQLRTSLSAPLEPASTLRGGGPLAAFGVAYRSKTDAEMSINAPGTAAARRHGDSRAFSRSAGKLANSVVSL